MIAVRTSRLYTDVDSEPLEDHTVIVGGERVLDVVPNSALTGSADSAQIVNATGLTALPGMIDMHLHVTTEGAGRLHEEMDLSFEQGVAQGVRNLENSVGWGVTTVRDAGSRNDAVLDLRDKTASGAILGPRVLPAGAPLTTHKGHLYWFGGEAEGPEAIRRFISNQAERGMTHVKVMVTGGWATPGSDPRVEQYSLDELRAAQDEAGRRGMSTMAHISSTEGVRRAVESGLDTLEHCMMQRPDGSWEYPSDLISRIVEQGCWVDPTPAWHYRTVKDPPSTMSSERLSELRRARDARIEVYRRLLDAGHDRWLVGTDTGGSNPQDYFPLVCEIMVKDIGLANRAVLRAATKAAAQMLGLHDEIGALRKGMYADMVMFDGDPIDDIMSIWNVRKVIARGQILDPVPDHSILAESHGGGWE